MASAARRKIISGGDGGAPIIKSRLRRLQIDGGGAAQRGRRRALPAYIFKSKG